MPEGWRFGRVSAVAADSAGRVYVFHRGPKADPIIVFDAQGKFVRSWGRGLFGQPHGLRVDRDGNVWVTDNRDHQVMKFTNEGQLLLTLESRENRGPTRRPSIVRPISPSPPTATSTWPTATATRAW